MPSKALVGRVIALAVAGRVDSARGQWPVGPARAPASPRGVDSDWDAGLRGPFARMRLPWTAKMGFRSLSVRGARSRSIDSRERAGRKWSSDGRVPTSLRFLPMIESFSCADCHFSRSLFANLPFMLMGTIDGSFIMRVPGSMALPCISAPPRGRQNGRGRRGVSGPPRRVGVGAAPRRETRHKPATLARQPAK